MAAALAILTSHAGAQEFKFQPPNLFEQKKPAPPRPKVDWNTAPPAGASAPSQPTVVCGMTVVPADPTMDPGMAKKPADTGTKYTLKVVEPTVCAPTHR
jgi:hypothetical protein